MTKFDKDICIIIPMYKDSFSDYEKISFNRIAKIFSTRKIFLSIPERLKSFAVTLMQNHENIDFVIFDDKYFGKLIKHNNMLMSLDFYSTFSDYNYLLICHLDVLVIKDDLNFWINQKFDIIGAPILEGYTNDNTGRIKAHGANGGFSLRNIESCIQILSTPKLYYSKISTLWKMETKWYYKIFRVIRDGLIFNYSVPFLKPRINEDMFWSVVVPDKYKWFNACSPYIALNFAFDVNPRHLFEINNFKYPMAIHAWWRYDKSFVIELINQIECHNYTFPDKSMANTSDFTILAAVQK